MHISPLILTEQIPSRARMSIFFDIADPVAESAGKLTTAESSDPGDRRFQCPIA
jgi:hypothetical protein